MKCLRVFTLFALFVALVVPTFPPAHASHYGTNSWLVDGLFEGEAVYTETVTGAPVAGGEGEFTEITTYTVSLPTQTITALDYSYSMSEPYYYQDGDVLKQCTHTEVRQETGETGQAEETGETGGAHPMHPNLGALEFWSGNGHTYYPWVWTVEWEVHSTESLTGCAEGMNYVNEGDYMHHTSTTPSLYCGGESTEAALCSTEDRTHLLGEDIWSTSEGDFNQTIELDWDVNWTPPEECAPAGTPSTKDSDGDRLQNAYETNVLFTDPGLTDSDRDCYGDALEVASGSDPTSSSETPDTLAKGTDPALLFGGGDSGSTCGRTKFKWVSPALKSLGVAADKPGCIFLYSNAIANKMADYAFKYDTNITTTLERMTAPYIKEIYGKDSVDWVKDRAVDGAVWGASFRYLKKGMRAGLNLSRLNAIFAVGKLAGLNAIALGGVWKLNQIRNNNACIQMRIGTTSDGSTTMSWSLVYSADQVTDPKLSFAGTWKRKTGTIDTAVRAPINLQCSGGSVIADGLPADKVFNDAVSHIF